MTIMCQVVHASAVIYPWSRHDRSSQQPWLGSRTSPSWAIRGGLWLGEGMGSVVVDCGVGQRNRSTTTPRPSDERYRRPFSYYSELSAPEADFRMPSLEEGSASCGHLRTAHRATVRCRTR